jgi:methylmalonyl-CoA/ethylmalonyl-CoA epimerase
MQHCCDWLRDTGFFLISEPVPAVAFDGRRVAWFRGPDRLLVELVESGTDTTFQ